MGEVREKSRRRAWGKGNYRGGNIMNLVFDRLSLRKYCDIHTNMLLSKFVIGKEIKGVSG